MIFSLCFTLSMVLFFPSYFYFLMFSEQNQISIDLWLGGWRILHWWINIWFLYKFMINMMVSNWILFDLKMGWFIFFYFMNVKSFFFLEPYFWFKWLRNLYVKKLKEKKAAQNPSAFAPKGNLHWFKVLHLSFVLPFLTFIWIPFMAITSSIEKPPCHMLWKKLCQIIYNNKIKKLLWIWP